MPIKQVASETRLPVPVNRLARFIDFSPMELEIATADLSTALDAYPGAGHHAGWVKMIGCDTFGPGQPDVAPPSR
jgi:hypothetical protein